MITATPSHDTLAESQRLIVQIERFRDEIPFAEDILAIHLPAHQELSSTHARSEEAVDAWRMALARRWECEVSGRRLYKRIIRQIADGCGGMGAPEVQAITRGEAEANSSPAELLADMRRLQAALSISSGALAFARDRLPELGRSCAALEAAIAEANLRETERRVAALDNRIASEAYRRAREATRRSLAAHYGERLSARFGDLLDH